MPHHLAGEHARRGHLFNEYFPTSSHFNSAHVILTALSRTMRWENDRRAFLAEPKSLVTQRGSTPATQFKLEVVCAQYRRRFSSVRLCSGRSLLFPALMANQAEDEATIRANAAKYVESYNRRDSKTMASMWSPDAVYTDDSTGESAVGRDAIKSNSTTPFAGAEDAKLKVNIDSIDFVSPNVAVEKGSAEVTYDKHPAEKSEYTAVHVQARWPMAPRSRHGCRRDDDDKKPPEPPPSNYEHLKELDWMVGSWIDKDEADDVTIQTDCEWTKNRNFMTRSFAVAIGDQVNKSGMQIIGWDPHRQENSLLGLRLRRRLLRGRLDPQRQEVDHQATRHAARRR